MSFHRAVSDVHQQPQRPADPGINTKGQRGFFYRIWTEAGPEWLKIMKRASENPGSIPRSWQRQDEPCQNGNTGRNMNANSVRCV